MAVLQRMTPTLLWSNTGALPTVPAESTKNFFKNTGTDLVASGANIPTNSWFSLTVPRRAKHLALQFAGKVTDVTGGTSLTSCQLFVSAQGVPYVDASTDYLAGPPAVNRANLGTPELTAQNSTTLGGSQLARMCNEPTWRGENIGYMSLNQPEALSAFLVEGKSAAADDFVGWHTWIGRRSGYQYGNSSGSYVGGIELPRVDIYDSVFLSVAFNVDWATTAPTALSMNAKLFAVFYRET